MPKIIDSRYIRHKIQNIAFRYHIDHVDYRSLYLSIFPKPNIVVKDLRIDVKKSFSAKIETMRVYPEWLKMLSGRKAGVKIFLDTPSVTAFLPYEPSGKKEAGKRAEHIDLAQGLSDLLLPIESYLSGLDLLVRDGGVDIICNDGRKFEVKLLDLDAGVDIGNPKNFSADLDISGAGLAFLQADKKIEIACEHLKSSLRVSGDDVIVSLADFRTANPAARLSGSFTALPHTSGFSLDLKGYGLDVSAIRKAALRLFGGNEVIAGIFSYLKGGRIPHIRIQSKSRELSDLGNMDNLVIQGRLLGGDIAIHPIRMQLSAVSGDVRISRGLLEASHASAKLGKTIGRDGFLKLGISQGNDAFHLGIKINADLAQVPGVLEGIIPPGAILRELSLFKDISGRATARLELGETLSDIQTRLEVSNMAFSASYRRLPFPLEIRDGRLVYQKNRVKIENLDGKIGKTSFSNLFCSVDWGGDIGVDMPKGRVRIDLDTFCPWLSSFEVIGKGLAGVERVGGFLELSEMSLDIPKDIDRTSKPLRFSATGDVDGVYLQARHLPDTLLLDSGKFRVEPDRSSFTDLKGRLMDAEFNLTGTISGKIYQPDSLTVGLNGRMGEKTISFLRKAGILKLYYPLRGPIRLSHTDIDWQASGSFSFKGDIFCPEGARLSCEFYRHAGGFTIKRLDIKDMESDAAVAFDFKKNEISLKFKGVLYGHTLGRVFALKKSPQGILKGDFLADFVENRWSSSSFEGRLSGKGIVFPFPQGPPLKIERLMLSGIHDVIDVKRLGISYDGSQADITGRLYAAADIFMFDLYASAGDLAFGFPGKIGNGSEGSVENEFLRGLADFPVKGVINLSARSLSLGKYTFKPFHARIAKTMHKIIIDADRADICGLDAMGTIDWNGTIMRLELKAAAKNRDFDSTYACLSGDRIKMSGKYDLHCTISSQGHIDDLMKNARGKFDFKAKKGVITKEKELARILEVINVTEIVKGRLPDLKAKGFRYNTIDITGVLSGNVIDVSKFYMDGKTLDILGAGTVELNKNTIDAKLLASPFKTVDSVIQAIPGVNYLLAGNLVSIPIRISGQLDDPKVHVMEISEISSNFLNFAERVIKSPVKLIKSVDFLKNTKKER